MSTLTMVRELPAPTLPLTTSDTTPLEATVYVVPTPPPFHFTYSA